MPRGRRSCGSGAENEDEFDDGKDEQPGDQREVRRASRSGEIFEQGGVDLSVCEKIKRARTQREIASFVSVDQ